MLHCSKHGENLQLFCEECGPLAVEKSRTSVGYALWQSLSPQRGAEAATAEIERRVQVRVVRVWAEGAYGQIQTRLDNGPWAGGIGHDEEDDPKDAYKFSQPVSNDMDIYLEGIGQQVQDEMGRGYPVSARQVFEASDRRYALEQIQAWFDAALPSLPIEVTHPNPGWADPFFGSGFEFE